MKQMICSICSYTYDESVGIPDAGIAPGTKWEDLPEDWKCPWCGAGKDAFREKQEAVSVSAEQQVQKPHVEKELSAVEMSIICSNLARGCEKQYLPEETVNNPVAYPDEEILQNGVSFAFLPPEISRYVESLFMEVRNS